MGIARPLKLLLRTTALTVVTAVAAVAAGPAAHAAGPFGSLAPFTPRAPFDQYQVDVGITPVSPRPGSNVEVRVTGCKSDKNATAHSEAFVTEVPLGRIGGALFGEGRVSSTIAPGVYAVDVSCDGKPKAGSARMVITGLVDPTKPPPPQPTAPVRAGGGGTAEQGAEQDSAQEPEALADPGDSAGPVAAPFGVTLLAGGLLAGAIVLAARRRRTGDADDS
jgi:hypothetical protein